MARHRLKRGDHVWWIDSRGIVCEMEFTGRVRGKCRFHLIAPPSWWSTQCLDRGAVYLNREDAENYARIVRQWVEAESHVLDVGDFTNG